MNANVSNEVKELREELEEIDGRTEAAALEEDYERFIILQARKTALPTLLREAKADVVRAEIDRLEGQRQQVAEQKAETASRPLEEFRPPIGQWNAPGADLVRRAAVSGVASREREIGSRIAVRRRELNQLLEEPDGA